MTFCPDPEALPFPIQTVHPQSQPRIWWKKQRTWCRGPEPVGQLCPEPPLLFRKVKAKTKVIFKSVHKPRSTLAGLQSEHFPLITQHAVQAPWCIAMPLGGEARACAGTQRVPPKAW